MHYLYRINLLQPQRPINSQKIFCLNFDEQEQPANYLLILILSNSLFAISCASSKPGGDSVLAIASRCL